MSSSRIFSSAQGVAISCIRRRSLYNDWWNYSCPNWRHISTTIKMADMFNVQDEADFKEKVLESKKPVVVDFHATWCGPCKALMPRLEKIIGGTKEGVDLAKVDIDNLPDIAMEYGVGAVPSVLSFKNGQIQDKFVGLKDDDEIQTFVNKLTK